MGECEGKIPTLGQCGRGHFSRLLSGRGRRQSPREGASCLPLQLGACKGKLSRAVRERLALPGLSLPSPAVTAKGENNGGGGRGEPGGFKSARA